MHLLFVFLKMLFSYWTICPLLILKIWVKYPLSSKYLQKCYGKISEAYKVIEEFEKESDKYDQFLNLLKPKNPVKEQVKADYSIKELQNSYQDLFEEPMLKSLIYHPK